MNAPFPQQLSLHLQLEVPPSAQLSRKAMLVRLKSSKPALTKRDAQAEQFTQQQLSDAGLRVSATLFKDKSSPIRQIINSATAVYHYHKENTLPYVDRGDRLLPVANYENYRDNMRKLIAEVSAEMRQALPMYDTYVQEDMLQRGSRAQLADYPSAEQFESQTQLKFTFSPLPDADHFLFDMSPEDKAQLQQQANEQLNDVLAAARADMFTRVHDPLKHLIEKLRVPAGQPGSIFRDSAVENIVESVQLVRKLAMGDADILAICDEVEQATTGHARAPHVLRESPIVREMAVVKLKEVSDKMAFMFGG